MIRILSIKTILLQRMTILIAIFMVLFSGKKLVEYRLDQLYKEQLFAIYFKEYKRYSFLISYNLENCQHMITAMSYLHQFDDLELAIQKCQINNIILPESFIGMSLVFNNRNRKDFSYKAILQGLELFSTNEVLLKYAIDTFEIQMRPPEEVAQLYLKLIKIIPENNSESDRQYMRAFKFFYKHRLLHHISFIFQRVTLIPNDDYETALSIAEYALHTNRQDLANSFITQIKNKFANLPESYTAPIHDKFPEVSILLNSDQPKIIKNSNDDPFLKELAEHGKKLKLKRR